ncbi:MAG: mechanosensitive ion channel family protein [Candidatus Diapherotrites archaeon]|nr:mechanosensitive ion channel family protein [Candidatus Diapherotrites archaeon]
MPALFDDLIVIVVAILCSILIGALISKVLLKHLKRLTSKTITSLDDKIIHALEKPIFFAVLLLGINFGLEFTEFKTLSLRTPVFQVLVILIVVHALFSLIDALIAWYVEEIEVRRKHKIGDIMPTIRRVVRIIIIALSATVILSSLGVEITPIIAALGIGGLAVALAFQDTLSNFFAGIYITMDRPIKLGDFVEFENTVRGYVVSIGWRSTKVRTLENNLVIISNSKLSQAIITNYYAPTKDMAVVIPCSVVYGSDLDKIEKITIDAAREVQKKVKGAVPDFDPFIRYHTFGDHGIQFSIILRVQEFVDQYLVKHEFVKELSKAYQKVKIEIPFPQVTVHMASQHNLSDIKV